MALVRRGFVDLPPHQAGGFDHGDVHLGSGRVFVAHTATGAIEIIDGLAGRHLVSVQGCPEASGVLCDQAQGRVFAAARGAGKVLVIDALTGSVIREFPVGPRPNGLAFDSARSQLLVADVEDLTARVIDPGNGSLLKLIALPGRPRWTVYDATRQRFLINIRDPAGVLLVSQEDGHPMESWTVPGDGPHGLDLDPQGGTAYVACDSAAVVALDLESGRELGSSHIAGKPDVAWCNAARNRLYISVGKPGVVEVIDSRSLAPIELVVTEEGCHTSAFDRTRQRLYAFLPGTCRAAIYDDV